MTVSLNTSATAVLYDAEIYTQDKHFQNLDRIHYFAK